VEKIPSSVANRCSAAKECLFMEVETSLPWLIRIPILSQLNLVNTLTPYFTKLLYMKVNFDV
jgi:hypothetical protein